jgi:hypothetical protein
LGVALISLVIAALIMARNNTGNITTSFSDTPILMRNMNEDFPAGAKLRLRAAEDDKLGTHLSRPAVQVNTEGESGGTLLIS